MNKISNVLSELGVSKVRLAKYLGVSRQMLYNYLALETLNEWPKEKLTKILSLLNIKSEEELENIVVDGNYLMEVEGRLSLGVKDSKDKEVITDLKGFSKKEQELLTNIIDIIKEKFSDVLAEGNKGALMKSVMPELKGKADGKLINEVVAKLIG